MQERIVQLTEEELANQEDIRLRRAIRKTKYYPDQLRTPWRRKQFEPLVLTEEQMINEELINRLNDQPANKRLKIN